MKSPMLFLAILFTVITNKPKLPHPTVCRTQKICLVKNLFIISYQLNSNITEFPAGIPHYRQWIKIILFGSRFIVVIM